MHNPLINMKLFQPLFAGLIWFSLVSCKNSDDVIPASKEKSVPTEEQAGTSSNCPDNYSTESLQQNYIVLLKNENTNREDKLNPRYKERIKERASSVLSRRKISLRVNKLFYSACSGFTSNISKSEAEKLKNDPDVKLVVQDKMLSIAQFALETKETEEQLIPWGIERVGKGGASEHTAWIMDTGIDTDHPDLNIDLNRSASFVCSEPLVEDLNGHGTHVAGTIGAIDNEYGVVGVAPGNRLVAIKVMDGEGKGTVSNLLAGLDYIYRNAQKGDVVNLSLSGGSVDILDQMVDQISSEKQIYFSMAAGNDSQSSDNLSPQRVNNPYVFTISAIDDMDNLASFSNYGNSVDYAAPGVKIASTYLDGKYAYLSGTSMAAPHFAGLLLLGGNIIPTDGNVLNDVDGSPEPIAVLGKQLPQ